MIPSGPMDLWSTLADCTLSPCWISTSAYDKIINAEVLLQHGDSVQYAKVLQRSLGPDGITVGKYDDNPGLNSIIYDVEFPDGTVKEYSANVIAENMLTQVDSDGFTMTLMEGIVDHKMDPRVTCM